MNDQLRTALETGDLGALLADAGPDETWSATLVNPETGKLTGGASYRFGSGVFRTQYDQDEGQFGITFNAHDDAADASACQARMFSMLDDVSRLATKLGNPNMMVVSHEVSDMADLGHTAFADTTIPAGMDTV